MAGGQEQTPDGLDVSWFADSTLEYASIFYNSLKLNFKKSLKI